jgi:hypothetical protein
MGGLVSLFLLFDIHHSIFLCGQFINIYQYKFRVQKKEFSKHVVLEVLIGT